MAFLRFDSNPLDLRSPKVESVSTLFDLMKNPQTSPNTIDVPALSLTDADSVAARISQEPLVAQALTLSSYVPDEQKQKLALIADADNLLDTTLNPLDVAAAAQRCRAGQQASRTPPPSCAPPPATPRTSRRRMRGAWPMRWTAGEGRPAKRAPAPPKRWCRASRPCWAKCRIP